MYAPIKVNSCLSHIPARLLNICYYVDVNMWLNVNYKCIVSIMSIT